MTKKFNCIKCGKCCEILPAHVPQLKDFLNKDKSCRHYDKSKKLCNIYENRPDICNIEKYYNISDFKNTISLEDFYKLNSEICKSLIKLK